MIEVVAFAFKSGLKMSHSPIPDVPRIWETRGGRGSAVECNWENKEAGFRIYYEYGDLGSYS